MHYTERESSADTINHPTSFSEKALFSADVVMTR